MKKIITLLILISLVLSGLGAVAVNESEKEDLISETIIFSQPIINEQQDYAIIELEETTTYSWETGKPALPVVTKVYTFPLGTIIDDVEVTFSNTIEKKISKPVKPSPEVYPDSIITMNVKNSEKEISYLDIDIYPEQRYSYRTGAGLKDGERVIFLTIPIQPVQYKPQENTILYSEIASIKVDYTPPDTPITFPTDYDLLILAPSQFESALERLVDYKNDLDPPVNTILVTLDEIPSGVGVDEQEDIKFYIKDAIETMGITYVILVGAGVEGEEIFPVRQAWIKSDEHEDYFPSDLYFADIYNSTMGFSDWDVDEDGKFAEYSTDMAEIDVHPDVYLGKIPCNNVNELNVVIDKIIWYKDHNKMVNRILQIGGDSFTGDSVNEGEYANTVVLTKLPGYTATRLWASDETLTKANIGKGFRSLVDFVDFCGHGSYMSIATHPPKDKSTWVPPETLISPWTGFLYFDFDLYNVKNPKKYPVCVYKSCSNSKYSDSDICFSWKNLNKKNGGGIAVYSASGISYGATGTDIVARTTGWMEVKSFEELVSTKIFGDVWGNSISAYYNTFSSGFQMSDWKTMLEWSLFGDPTLAAEDGIDPMSRPAYRPAPSQLISRVLDRFPVLARLLELI
ncbi:MAG: hypothetical protein KAR55_02875 [Thermoplasmatales archaeon]|nr:hypothetical protein [Thermoplasmatales archaeon]